VLISENPFHKKQERLEFAKIFFDSLCADSLSMINGASLSLFSTGKTRGLVVEIGEGVTHVVPIFEGFALQHAALISHIAGRDITTTLIDGMAAEGININNKMLEVGRDIKEKMCTVPLDYQAAIDGPDPLNGEQRLYDLPDGTVIQVNHKKRYCATEILFDPSIAKLTGKSLPAMIVESIKKCPKLMRNVTYRLK
jgi:actin-related protein